MERADQLKFIECNNEKYELFLHSLYEEKKRVQAHLDRTDHFLSEKNPYKADCFRFMLQRAEKVVAHAALFVRGEDAFVGMYDCINDQEVAKKILDEVMAKAQSIGCSSLKGPITLSIWHEYRFVTKNKQPHVTDPLCKPYYAKQWESYGFEQKVSFVSATRDDLSYIIDPTKQSYELLQGEGYSFVSFEKKDLKAVYDIASSLFGKSWAATPLSFEEFCYIYEKNMSGVDMSYSQLLVSDKKQVVGFCFCFPNPLKPKQFIVKTIGVVADEQGKKRGAGLLHSVHKKIEKDFDQCYYPLILSGNNVTKFPYGGYEIVSEYAAYEKVIKH